MAYIELHDVAKEYRLGSTTVSAVGGVSLCIERGEFVAVMGPSGSGKSTLLSIIGGLMRPTGGSVRIDGIALEELSVEELADFRRDRLGFVFQAFHLIPHLSALENVMIPIAVERDSRRTKRNRARKVLETVGLADKADRLPAQLSGGEQERVAIARALVNEPDIILGDEPTGNLDSKTGSEVIKGLKRLNALGKTVIMVTHNPEAAAEAGRVVAIRDGRLDKEVTCFCEPVAG